MTNNALSEIFFIWYSMWRMVGAMEKTYAEMEKWLVSCIILSDRGNHGTHHCVRCVRWDEGLRFLGRLAVFYFDSLQMQSKMIFCDFISTRCASGTGYFLSSHWRPTNRNVYENWLFCLNLLCQRKYTFYKYGLRVWGVIIVLQFARTHSTHTQKYMNKKKIEIK